MNLADLSPLANHIWQSTLCAVLACLLTFALRKNRAAVRYWIWLAASVKFLIPFSLLVTAGGHFGWRTAPVIPQSQFSFVMEEVGRPFAPALPALPHAAAPVAPDPVPVVLFGLWFCGFGIGVIYWVRCWRAMRAARRAAIPLQMNLPIQAMSSPTRLEPGVFGIRKPVLLLPAGISARLTPAQLQAVLSHELCHVRRRDNLTATVHMVVETIFWFHPLVWWIRARLVEEREHACDEAVLELADPHVYAEGILNVCKFYLESPLPCASGVTGADLKKRIEKIMAHRLTFRLDPGRRILLASAAVAILVGPFAAGLMNASQSQSASPTGNAPGPAFEVASIKLTKPGTRGGQIQTDPGRLTITNIPLRTCIKAAFHLQDYQILGGPGWLTDDHFDIVAKAEGPAGDDQLWLMLQRLLADRFKLTLRRETKDMQGAALVVDKGGPKLHQMELAGKGWVRNGIGRITGEEVSMPQLAAALAGRLGRPVLDQTGLPGVFEVKLEWSPDLSTIKSPAEDKEYQALESASDPSGLSIFSALQEQLGLKLEARKVPVEFVTIDHVERPSGN